MDKKVQVLIVEDDANIRDIYKVAIEAVGFEVLLAENGKEGVELALKYHPAAIMMDIMMPVMNGHQAVHEIRKDSWGKEAKIIYLTNMSDAENVVVAVRQGTEKYIVKANAELKEVVNLVRTIAHT